MQMTERLAWLKGSRAISAWERELGIARGVLDRALRGKDLSEDNLRKLCRGENASADWVLDGKGLPYRLSRFAHDAELADQLQAHYDDEAGRWTVHVIRRAADGVPCAVILSMPAETAQAGDLSAVKHIVMECLAGPLGPLSSQVLCRAGWRAVKGVALADDAAMAVANGQIGTYALFFEPGYCVHAKALNTDALRALEGAVADAKNGYNVPLTLPEQGLLQTFRALPAADRHRLSAIADTLKTLADNT